MVMTPDEIEELKTLRPGDWIQVFHRRDYQDAHVLAVCDNLALIELVLSSGASTLREVYKSNPQIKIGNVDYYNLPARWREAIPKDALWIGCPRQNRRKGWGKVKEPWR